MADAYQSALKWLVRREYAEKELRQKLSQADFDENTVNQTLEKLKKDNFQSDARFREMLVRTRINQGKGSLLIQQQLKQYGIDECQLRDIDFCQLARQALIKKYGDTTATNNQEKAKRLRFLQSRGFSFADINQVLKT